MRRLWVAGAVSLLLLAGMLSGAGGLVTLPGVGAPNDSLTPTFVTSGASLRLIP